MQRDPSDYLAGMWKEDLPLSMLWHKWDDRRGPKPVSSSDATEMKYAPSWSWASILRPIEFVGQEDLVATVNVLDVHIARASPNLFDGANFCRIRLRGPVCKFRRRIQDGAPWIHVAQHTAFRDVDGFDFQDDKTMIIDWDTSREAVVRWLQSFGDDAPASVQPTQVLLHIASGPGVDGPEERGIILQRTAVRGTYTRIGLFFIPPETEYRGSELEDAFNGRFDTLSPDDYLELDSTGKYVIDIV